jgi:hypothetical protein
MTIQISTPNSWTDFTSRAILSTVGGFNPKPLSPIKASPEIFSITLLNWGTLLSDEAIDISVFTT